MYHHVNGVARFGDLVSVQMRLTENVNPMDPGTVVMRQLKWILAANVLSC